MKTKPFTRVALSAAITATLMSGAALAQDNGQAQSSTATPTAQAAKASPGAQQAANAKNAQTLQEVVVTGTAATGGIKKIDASYSITSMTAEQIREANPKSVADLLKASPGVYPESSGGQTGANIEVAGFPGGGDAPFYTAQINGVPLYPMSNLSFMEHSTMFRLDDTVDRVEIVQGGPSVLYGNGQPGVTSNFILREGTDVPSGDIGVTFGSEGLYRLDGYLGGKLADGWYASVGGFWRRSDGVRNPQFPADNGGQLTATLTRDWDSGSLMFYARALKDHNQFVTDTPIFNPGKGNFSNYPGFDALTGTFGSKADQREFIATTPCYTAGCSPAGLDANLAKGRGADLREFGSNFDWDFGNGWSLSDKIGFTTGELNTISFFSTGANPTSLGQYISSQVSQYQAAGVLPAGSFTPTAVYTSNGAAADMNGNVNTQGLWWVRKNLQSASNEFHVNKELFDGNTLTLGNFTAVYSDHDTWYLGNDMLLQAQNNPSPIAVTLNNGVNTWNLTDPQGFVGGPTFAMHERWNGFNTALFLTDVWKLNSWTFDAGFRYEHQKANGVIQGNGSNGLAPTNPFNLAANYTGSFSTNSAGQTTAQGAEYLTNKFTPINYSRSKPSYTLGVNYEFNPNMSAYVRANIGVHFPGFDDLRGLPTTPIEKIRNYEIGFKYQADWIYADTSAYRRMFYNVPYTITFGNGQQQTFVYGSETWGLNFITTVKPFEHASISFSGDYMDGHYNRYVGCVNYTAQDGSAQCTSINGMQLQRQPKFQFRLTPAYDFPTSWGKVRAWITYEYVGDRYGDLIQQQPLGNYYDLAFGVQANVGQHWVYSVQGTNLTNQIGITEGNARLFGFASSGGVILARSIEGREVQGQIKYNF